MLKHAWLASAAMALLGSVTFATEPAKAALREIEIIVDHGYKPSTVTLQEGEPVRLKFLRKDYSGCTKEVVFPSLNIRRELPTDKPVFIDLPALAKGEVGFQCGMNMLKGVLKVEPKKS